MHVVATAGHVDHGKSTLVARAHRDGARPPRRGAAARHVDRARLLLDGLADVGTCVRRRARPRAVRDHDAGRGRARCRSRCSSSLPTNPGCRRPPSTSPPSTRSACGTALLVVTRADLADPAPALDRARGRARRARRCGAPAVAVSGRTGAGPRRAARDPDGRAARRCRRRDPRADVRLWVDRRFHVRGAGTVGDGDAARRDRSVSATRCRSTGAPVRVRAVESLGVPVTVGSGVARVALDLGGKAPADLRRGSVARHT